MAAHHLGEGHKADILAVGCIRQAAEQGHHGRTQAVGHYTALQFLVRRLAVGAAHRDAGNVADRLDRGDERHDAHQPDEADRRRRTELEPEMHFGQAEPACTVDRVDLLGIYHAEGNGDDITDRQAEKDRCGRPDAFAVAPDKQDCQDHEQGQQPVRHIAEPARLAERSRIGAAPGRVFDAHRQQRKADGHHYDA